MDPKHQNDNDGRGILISQLEKTCSSAFKEFSQNFCEFLPKPQAIFPSTIFQPNF